MVDHSKNRVEYYAAGKLIDMIKKNLSQNADIQDLMLGTGYNNPMDKDAYLLTNSYIVDNLFIDSTQSDTKSYICLDAVISKSENKINQFMVTMYIFMHNSLLKMSSSETAKFIQKGMFGNRLSCLIDVVVRSMYDDFGNVGIGSVNLVRSMPMGYFQPSPTSPYYGKTIKFEVYDFK
jgi:hypothetical protein